MSQKVIHFTATTVECSEAIDWEIVQVSFDAGKPGIEETGRTSPYLLISANFEFGDEVQIEFHDGKDYNGDSVTSIDLWRDRVLLISGSGCEFDIVFNISDDALTKLRKFLKILFRSDCFRE